MYSTVFWKLLFLYNFAHIVGQPGPGLCETVSKRRGGRKEGGGEGGEGGREERGGGEGGRRRPISASQNPIPNPITTTTLTAKFCICKASAIKKEKSLHSNSMHLK